MTTRRPALARRRKAVGHTQESLAHELGIDRSTIVLWEAGTTEPLPWQRPRIAKVLRISVDDLDAILSDTPAAVDSRPAAPAVTSTPPQPPPVVIHHSGDTSVMHAFRTADKRIGGGQLYRAVVTYLHTEVAPRLFGSSTDTSGCHLFSSAAAFTEMAGWMAHEAGQDTQAGQHFRRSLDFATVGGDQQLIAHILGSMAHLAHHEHEPAAAIELARRGTHTLAGAQPRLQARLLALQARGYAALRQPYQCAQLLTEAESVLERSPAEETSLWVSHFDEGSLASESARCMRQIGDYHEARRQAERVIELRPRERVRSHAFGQLGLAAAYLAHGQPEEACAVARGVLDATESLSSYLVVQQLIQLTQALQRYSDVPAVAEFLDCLHTTLPRRLLVYQGLDNDPDAATARRTP
jgi:DNA-binding XRE family transcriptional regulator/tetratricopeptide (TPR) repeat protein